MRRTYEVAELIGEEITYIDPSVGSAWVAIETASGYRYFLQAMFNADEYHVLRFIFGDAKNIRGEKITESYKKSIKGIDINVLVTKKGSIAFIWDGLSCCVRERTYVDHLIGRPIDRLAFENIMMYLVDVFSVDAVLDGAEFYKENNKFSWEM